MVTFNNLLLLACFDRPVTSETRASLLDYISGANCSMKSCQKVPESHVLICGTGDQRRKESSNNTNLIPNRLDGTINERNQMKKNVGLSNRGQGRGSGAGVATDRVDCGSLVTNYVTMYLNVSILLHIC